MKLFMKKACKFAKEKCWYLILLGCSSIYVWYYRLDINQLEVFNAQNLIFILWLLLLLFPLFSEMEFLGVKVKREVEKATEEVKDSLQNIQSQIAQIQMTNSVATNFNFGNTPLPTEKKLEELLKMVRELQQAKEDIIPIPNGLFAEETDYIPKEKSTDNMDKNVSLFKVRLEIETALRELCEKIGYTGRISVMKMVQLLNRAEIVTGVTCDLITQVCKIANRGVHGEIVSDEYITFVEEVYPEIIRQLKEISAQLRYINCPKCKYSGYSKYENVCPQCGYVHDDD